MDHNARINRNDSGESSDACPHLSDISEFASRVLRQTTGEIVPSNPRWLSCRMTKLKLAQIVIIRPSVDCATDRWLKFLCCALCVRRIGRLSKNNNFRGIRWRIQCVKTHMQIWFSGIIESHQAPKAIIRYGRRENGQGRVDRLSSSSIIIQ